MANMPKFSDKVWNKIKEHQIEKLKKMEVVSNLRSQYIDDFAPYRMYLLKANMTKDNYDVKGFEHITFTLNCPAVVGFSNAKYGFKAPGSGSGNGKPTKIHERDVYVTTEHQMEIYLQGALTPTQLVGVFDSQIHHQCIQTLCAHIMITIIN